MKINLLGRFSVQRDGKELNPDAISGKKARSLLKLLALQRHYQMVRDQAIDTLWPDLDVQKGSAQLYKAIYHIRQGICSSRGETSQGEWIELSEEAVRLKPANRVTTDVNEFEKQARLGLETQQIRDLERASLLYTGELLPMDLYAEWTEIPRHHLQQLYLDVLLALAEQHRLRGDQISAAESARQALIQDPALEKAHRELMKIYALQDQRHRALRQYQTCLEVLDKELNISPSRDTVELAEDIQQQQTAQEKTDDHMAVSSTLNLTPLIDRQKECQAFLRILDLLPSSRGHLMIIKGPMGIGKTRLIQELTLRAKQRDYQVLVGNTQDQEAAVAYNPFIEILQTALKEDPEDSELLPPAITDMIPNLDKPSQSVPNSDRNAALSYLFARILRFFNRRAAQRPLVLILENFHAADKGSVSLFYYLARNITEMPILVAVTCRTEDDGKDFLRQWRNNRRDLPTSSETLSVSPLTEYDQQEFLERQCRARVSPQVNHDIYRLSEGNPLFARELCQINKQHEEIIHSLLLEPSVSVNRKSRGQVPAVLRDIVWQRMDDLTSPAHRLLYLFAILGRRLDYETLMFMWRDLEEEDSEEEVLLDILDELIASRLIEEHGLSFRFPHALFRAAVYEFISEARRRMLHNRVAQNLLRLYQNPKDQPVEQIAFHFFKAGDAQQAAHYLMLAGKRAESVYSHSDALNRYQEALQVLEALDDNRTRRMRCTLNERIGDVYRLSGQQEKSFDVYKQALSEVASLPLTRLEQAELYRKMALSSIYIAKYVDAQQYLSQAEELADSDAKTRARVMIVKALFLWHENQLKEAAAVAEDALQIAETLGAETEVGQACEMLAMTYLPLGQWEKGLEYEKRRYRAGWSPDIILATDAHLCLWEYYAHIDETLDKVISFQKSMAGEAARHGQLRCVAISHYALGTMYLWRGEYAKVVDELQKSLELHEQVGSPAGMGYALARKAAYYNIQGNLELGWQTINEGISVAKQAAVFNKCVQRLTGVALWNRIEAEDWPAAQSLVDQCEKEFETIGMCAWCSLELLPWLVLYYLLKEKLDKAIDYADEIESLIKITNHAVGKSIFYIVQSTIEAARGRTKPAQQLQKKATDLIENSILRGSSSYLTHFFDRMIEYQKKFA
ncbi:MAG: AAA family ATPase [candidate division Zixibacteria bacterium]|nr:AAA family ATPase [candidate division Zixibacteria bacterium]